MTARKKEWYESWFDSPYYHILYKDRDEKEARLFLDNLIALLKPQPGSRILDVACGKGRHSVYLNKKGFSVCGFDLSRESIAHNQRSATESLSFYVHDMRELFRRNAFQLVFNLFSSFGYFDEHSDNEKVIAANAAALLPGGFLVIDYMNSEKVATELVSEDVKECKGIRFLQQRKIRSGKIVKKISFSSGKKEFVYEEHLQLYSLPDFEKMFAQCGLEMKNIFGDYQLQPFNPRTSDRLILIAAKN